MSECNCDPFARMEGTICSSHATVESLNESQRGHLLTNIVCADRLLCEIEEILAGASSKSPFLEYRVDVTPAQGKVIQDHIARIREQMLRALDGQGIRPPSAQLGAIQCIQVRLEFVRIALTELGPKYMRGYGEVPECVTADLNGLVAELNTLVDKLNAYLTQGLGQDLALRIERLQGAGDDAGLLREIERVISAQGLVEFRSKLAIILDRLETRRFEIGIFGRVSSGKSSLLNHILQVNVLPVGVNPITAVPTRLVSGPEPRLTVALTDNRVEHHEVTALPDFVTEQRNPLNSKGVTRIEVALTAPLLSDGVVFVDTPGLGSLATFGAAETRAYLPQCDLGVVLINASAALAEEDLATIQVLYEAGVPASVLLSKADLLAQKDLESVLAYTAEQIRGHLGLALKVQPVSIVGDCAALSDKWFEEQIKPLYKRHQQLADESVRRKIAALRESVEAALRSKLDRIEGTRPPDVEALRLMERELRRAAGRIPEETSGCLQSIEEVDELAPLALRDAARRIIERWRQGQNAEAGIVTASALETACAVTNPLYSRLVAFARELTDSLQQAAKLLNATDFPQEEDLVSALREMPQFDFHWKALSFKRSPFVSLAAPLVKVGLKRRLHYLIGPGMQEAFRSYQRLLEAWVRRAIAEIHTRFDSHADAYRAHLARLLGSAEASPHVAERIRRDLAALRGDGASQTNA